jgi:hypothetical protein
MSAALEAAAKALFHRTFGSEADWDAYPGLAKDAMRDDAQSMLDAVAKVTAPLPGHRHDALADVQAYAESLACKWGVQERIGIDLLHLLEKAKAA